MALQTKIFLLNIILAVAITVGFAYATDTWPGNGFFLMTAFIALAGGLGSLALGLLLLLRKDKRAAKAFLITAVLLLGVSLCSYFFLKQY